MTQKQIFKALESLTHDKIKKHNTKSGVGDNQFGVKLGDIRKIAKRIKVNQKLALELWETENYDACMLAVLIMDPNKFSEDELDKLVCSIKYDRVADWVNSYIVKPHPDNESLRIKWMQSNNPMAARAGWNLTKQRVVNNPDMVDIPSLLDRLENEMAEASPIAQWTMNFTLAEIGIHHEKYRDRAIDIGERLGIYQEYPTSKGCVSPYAPIWIREIVSRQV